MTSTTNANRRGDDVASAADIDQRIIDAVYRRRARQLAQRKSDRATSGTFGMLVFRLGSERYGVRLSELSEALTYRGCATVPGAPTALLGVVNVRGDIRSVVNLRQVLGLPDGEESGAGYLVMLRRHDGVVGLKVDVIDEVRQVDPADLMSATNGTASIAGARFVTAVTADLVMLVDTSLVLADLGFDNG